MIPTITVDVRRQLCEQCPAPCAERPNLVDECARCPTTPARWGTWGRCSEGEHRLEERAFGLGDAVAAIAQPIARTIDKLTGHRTNVAGCGGCKQRQAALNKLVPDLR